MIQAAVYGGYFLMAMPAGYIISRWGYKAGVLTGLVLYGIGALLFIPGADINSFAFFVFSLFVIGCGLTCLETSANPYTTVLGDPKTAESRINLAQCLNGIGWIVGPFVGGMLLFNGGSIAMPYAIVGITVLVIAAIFAFLKLPDINNNQEIDKKLEVANDQQKCKETHYPSLRFGIIALFCYVAAQTGVNSFFINYMGENVGLSNTVASQWLAFGGMGLFVFGRFSGGIIMNYVRGEKLLCLYAIVATLATLLIILYDGVLSMIGFFIVYLCESIMFPTIFALALRSQHGNTKKASSYLIMTIVGGAIAPPLMGMIADYTDSVSLSYIIPLICYEVVFAYALRCIYGKIDMAK